MNANPAEMTNDELAALAWQNWQEFTAQNGWTIVGAVARQLGHDPASRDLNGQPTYYRSTCGPKYVWESNGVKVYVDDYGHYMTVDWNGVQVGSTHDTNRFVIPGAWMTEVWKHYPAAQQAIAERERQRNDAERQRLLKMVAYDLP